MRVADRDQLVADHAHEHVALGEDPPQLLDLGPELLLLLDELVATELRQPSEDEIEDVVGLDLAVLEPRPHQPGSGHGAILRRLDQRDDRVDLAERLDEALDDVEPGLGLVEPVPRAPGDDHHLVIDPLLQRLREVDRAGDAVDQRDHVDAEGRLRGRVLEDVVEDDLRVRVGAQLDHEPRAPLSRLVADVADALDPAALHRLRELPGDGVDARSGTGSR